MIIDACGGGMKMFACAECVEAVETVAGDELCALLMFLISGLGTKQRLARGGI